MQRRCEEYLQAQRAHRWSHGEVEDLSSEDNADFRVGILGFGECSGCAAGDAGVRVCWVVRCQHPSFWHAPEASCLPPTHT